MVKDNKKVKQPQRKNKPTEPEGKLTPKPGLLARVFSGKRFSGSGTEKRG